MGPVVRRLLLLASLVLAACAAPRTYRAVAGPPEVRRFDAAGLALEVPLAVRGGAAAARVRAIDWEVLVGELPIGVGTTAVEEVVPPGGEVTVALPLALETGAELPAGVRPALARGGSVAVTVRGVVRLRDREGPLEVPFSVSTRARIARDAPLPRGDEPDDEGP
jgi:hypothetical protein